MSRLFGLDWVKLPACSMFNVAAPHCKVRCSLVALTVCQSKRLGCCSKCITNCQCWERRCTVSDFWADYYRLNIVYRTPLVVIVHTKSFLFFSHIASLHAYIITYSSVPAGITGPALYVMTSRAHSHFRVEVKKTIALAAAGPEKKSSLLHTSRLN